VRLLTTREEVMSRLYKIGSGAAAMGAIHVLTLLLSWYVQVIDGTEKYIQGLVSPYATMMSLVGGILAGVGVIIIHVIKGLRTMKNVLGISIIVGGLLTTISPIYSYWFWLLELSSYSRFDLGFFAATFTGVILLAVGALALLTPVKEEVIPSTLAAMPPAGPELMEAGVAAPSPSRPATTKIVPAPDVAEAICSICFDFIPEGEAVRCSSCDAIFHKGCIDSWVSINGICPSCKAVVTES
jgi:hypothetical protein